MVGFNFAPAGWMFCNGQTLAIRQYDVLFNLIGTTYGGDDVQTFQLPNLQGRLREARFWCCTARAHLQARRGGKLCL
jgi:microcystin-dependent protein